VLTSGLPASPGAASGAIVLDADTAEKRAAMGEAVVLVRVETSPEDIHGMHAAKGILTARGGMTSHAAVVARGMGRPCVSGASAVSINMASRTLRIGGRELKEGDQITLDGTTGEVMAGHVPTIEPELVGDFGVLMGWADQHRRMKVRTNAESPADCRTARQFGAEGVGLCRTEHMFFDASRIAAVRQMILAGADLPDLRAKIQASAPHALDALMTRPHVAIAPPVRNIADDDLAALCLAEELAKLEARRGARREIEDAMEDMDGLPDEGLTWRLTQAAEARHRSERSGPTDSADLGEDRAALSKHLQSMIDAQVWVRKSR